MEKNYIDDLGTAITLTVRGMEYHIREILSNRESKINMAITEILNSQEILKGLGDDIEKEINKQIKEEIRQRIGYSLNSILDKLVMQRLAENKEVNKAIQKSIIDNKTAIAESIIRNRLIGEW